MKFSFWVKYLSAISIFLCIFSISWAIIGSFDPLGIYDYYFAKAFWQMDRLPVDAAKAKSFLLGPFGATSAAYFLLQFFITKYGYAQRQLWAYKSILYGFFFWFTLDTIVSLFHQAYFNIIIVNIPCMLMMLPIVFTRKYFVDSSQSPDG